MFRHYQQISSNALSYPPQVIPTDYVFPIVYCALEGLKRSGATQYLAETVDYILSMYNLNMFHQYTLWAMQRTDEVGIPHHLSVDVTSRLHLVTVGMRDKDDLLTSWQW